MTPDEEAYEAYVRRVVHAAAPLDAARAALIAPLLPVGRVSGIDPQQGRAAA